MLKDIQQLTELYLHASGQIPEDKSWYTFHDEVTISASKDYMGLFADAGPRDKCKYALFINVDTKRKECSVEDPVEIGAEALGDWPSHLFWQYSGGRKDRLRNTPHKLYETKKSFSVDGLLLPLQTILEDYCKVIDGKGKAKRTTDVGPLFWDKDKNSERIWLNNIAEILISNKEHIEISVKGGTTKDGIVPAKFPATNPTNKYVFIGLTIDDRPIGHYELFRRYLFFARTRAGVQEGADIFANKILSDVSRELGECPLCHRMELLLDQWQGPAELSFYQTTNQSHLSHAYPSEASFKLCQACADLLFLFKQRLLATSTRKLGGYECLILPAIKIVPRETDEKRGLYRTLQKLWESQGSIQSTETKLIYRLSKLPSYATVTFVFGDHITVAESNDVKRLDRLNVVFPDVLPSRLSKVAEAMENSNTHLYQMWALTGRDWQCPWGIQDDFYLLYRLFHPVWEEKKKNNRKSRRRAEIERYLRAIFYGEKIPHDKVVEDSYSNLLASFRISRTEANSNDNRKKYAFRNYNGDILSLLVLLERLVGTNDPNMGVNVMNEGFFKLSVMPDLGEFTRMHPLLKESEYLAPFFIGCLFSYAEWLQKENSRLAAYNWLGTMALRYEDILQGVYPKVLRYITAKEKLVASPRLQELMRAIAYYDRGKCTNDRVALVAFCHGWAVGLSFIMKKDIVKTIKQKFKELNFEIDEQTKAFLEKNRGGLNSKDSDAIDQLRALLPEVYREAVMSVLLKTEKDKTNEDGGDTDEQ